MKAKPALAMAGLLFIPVLAAAKTGGLRETPVVEAVRKASPAVVNINTEQVIRERVNPFYDHSRDPYFDEFFRDFFEPFSSRRKYTKQSLGSGVIIDQQGYILTNEHVILKSSKIKVTLADGREFEGKIVGSDPKNDLAVVKIKSKATLPYLPLGSSGDLMIGETVIAIGNPFGLSHTVTTGVISSLDRSLKVERNRVYNDFIQTDASINPGNSGGPLLNIAGELIGINSAIYQKAQGIGFAIPIDRAKRIVDDLIKFGEVQAAWLGLFVQDLTRELAKYFGYTSAEGALVTKVVGYGPALPVGVKPGDIIVSLNGKKIKSKRDYQANLSGFTSKDKISLGLFRNGKARKVNIIAGEFPLKAADELAYHWLGIEVGSIRLSGRLASHMGVAVKRVKNGGPAYNIGIRRGDIIRQINNQTITGLESYRKAIWAAQVKDSVLLLVQRGEYGYYVTLQP